MDQKNCVVIQDISQFTVIIGGHTVTGWSEDGDCLMMPDVNDIVNFRRGGDGQLLGSYTNNIGGAVSIKLLPNSSSTAFFMQVVASMFADKTRKYSVCWSGSVTNNSQSYSFDLINGVLVSAPLGQTVGKDEISNQIFTWEFHRIVPRYETSLFRDDPKDSTLANSIVNRDGNLALDSQD